MKRHKCIPIDVNIFEFAKTDKKDKKEKKSNNDHRQNGISKETYEFVSMKLFKCVHCAAFGITEYNVSKHHEVNHGEIHEMMFTSS